MRKGMLTILGLAALAAGQATAQVARPTSFWYSKVFTTERSRQVYVALNANMWVLYDLPNAVLYQAWKGGTTGGKLEQATPAVTPEYWFKGGAHFPHIYVTAGANYFRDQVGEYFATYTKPADIDLYYTKWPKQPLNYKNWVVMNGTTDAGAKVRNRGYSVQGNVFVLKFDLVLPDKTEITVTESPEFSDAGGKNNLVRTLTFAGIPAGHQVRMLHPGGDAAAWSVTSGTATLSAGILTQTANGQTVLTGSW